MTVPVARPKQPAQVEEQQAGFPQVDVLAIRAPDTGDGAEPVKANRTMVRSCVSFTFVQALLHRLNQVCVVVTQINRQKKQIMQILVLRCRPV